MIEASQNEEVSRFAELPSVTQKFLVGLSKEDIDTLETGLPLLRALIGFGKVTRWIAVAIISIAVGLVMLGDSVQKILSWLRH